MIAAFVFIGLLAFTVAAALSLASVRLASTTDSVIEKVNDLLPQTQCGQCGYPGCRPYAEAIVAGTAEINQCPPGSDATIYALSRLLNHRRLPLNASLGEHKSSSAAVIDEDACIGCALCLQACPVDAILGAPSYMHTIITHECTGCELCIAPCPVDCISLVRKTPDN